MRRTVLGPQRDAQRVTGHVVWIFALRGMRGVPARTDCPGEGRPGNRRPRSGGQCRDRHCSPHEERRPVRGPHPARRRGNGRRGLRALCRAVVVVLQRERQQAGRPRPTRLRRAAHARVRPRASAGSAGTGPGGWRGGRRRGGDRKAPHRGPRGVCRRWGRPLPRLDRRDQGRLPRCAGHRRRHSPPHSRGVTPLVSAHRTRRGRRPPHVMRPCCSPHRSPWRVRPAVVACPRRRVCPAEADHVTPAPHDDVTSVTFAR